MNYKELVQLIEQEQLTAAKTSCLRMEFYAPQWECINATTPIIGLLGGNQCGKTISALSRVRFDATGEYPEHWTGNKTIRGMEIWVCGDTYDTLRDGIQKKLFGTNLDQPGVMQPGDLWPPMVPADMIVGKPLKVQNSGGCIDSIKIRHVSGGVSTITFKTYAQGMEGLASATLDLVVIDEEPKWEILLELFMRVLVRNGTIMITFTPTHGKTRLYRWLTNLPRHIGTVAFLGQDHAKHLSRRMVGAMEMAFADDPRAIQARKTGKAVSLSGLIFPFDTDKIWIDPFPIPPEWPRIIGSDVGWSTPTTGIALAQNLNTGEWFGYSEYSQAERTPRDHHFAMLDQFGDLNVGMDTASNQSDKATGQKILDEFNKSAHGDGYELWLPESFRKYQKAERSFDVGYTEMLKLFQNDMIYFFKPTRMEGATFKDGVVHLKQELEEYEWDKEGNRPANRNRFHHIDGFRYAVVSKGRAKPLFWDRAVEFRAKPKIDVAQWQRTKGNLSILRNGGKS